MTSLRIALAQYPIGRFADFAAWQANAAHWVEQAARDGAQLLAFPEYGAMELTSLLPENLQADLQAQIPALARFHDDFVDTYAALAKRHGVHILAPSLPVPVNGRIHNRAHLLSPNGTAFQDKRQMTRFEKEQWGVTGGETLKVFDIGAAKIGIAICYDIEFPLIAHALSNAGADLVLAPSCTDTLAGAHRVHVGAAARALENQIYVALSPTVGEAPWSPAVDVNNGWAAVYATPDRGFPDDGVLARGTMNAPGWVHAELDFARLRAARETAQVFTRKDWDGQSRPSLSVEAIALA
ncbi:MAG TPA: carbon-nitrogen hydrolase family protein [Rhizomicrobium sp.]|nr:carbon-nitrogen hydrolase family protein [Rhizomicrobium sp.]